jgi:hypothetical protein
MTFEPNDKSIAQELAKLREKQPGGGYLTPDDMRLIVSERKWACAPLVGDFVPNSEFIFWAKVESHLKTGW